MASRAGELRDSGPVESGPARLLLFAKRGCIAGPGVWWFVSTRASCVSCLSGCSQLPSLWADLKGSDRDLVTYMA